MTNNNGFTIDFTDPRPPWDRIGPNPFAPPPKPVDECLYCSSKKTHNVIIEHQLVPDNPAATVTMEIATCDHHYDVLRLELGEWKFREEFK